jgi:hypothetical protein
LIPEPEEGNYKAVNRGPFHPYTSLFKQVCHFLAYLLFGPALSGSSIFSIIAFSREPFQQNLLRGIGSMVLTTLCIIRPRHILGGPLYHTLVDVSVACFATSHVYSSCEIVN